MSKFEITWLDCENSPKLVVYADSHIDAALQATNLGIISTISCELHFSRKVDDPTSWERIQVVRL